MCILHHMENPISTLKLRIKASSLRKTAVELGISGAYLCDIMKGNRNPGPKVLKALGMTREVTKVIRYKA